MHLLVKCIHVVRTELLPLTILIEVVTLKCCIEVVTPSNVANDVLQRSPFAAYVRGHETTLCTI